ncbi:MAG: TolC family protein [Firmicutes bacterium]|nr:TolC family protein [Bacillota bacterium]
MIAIEPLKPKRYFWLLFSMVLSLACSNSAQGETLINLDQAVRMALEHDYQLRIAGNNLAKANLVVKGKVIDALPQMELGAEKGKNLSSDADLQNASVTITETIPTNFQLYGQKTASPAEVAKWERRTSEADYLISRAEVKYNTVSLYLNAVKAKRLLDYREAAVESAQAKAENAKTQLSLGKITKVAQLTAENDLAKARYELESSRQEYLALLKQLAQQIGVKDYRSLDLDQTIAPRQALEIADEVQLQAAALKQRLELQKTQVTVKEAEQELARAVNAGLPVLSLAYQNRSREESYKLEYDFLNGDLSWSGAWQKDYLDDINYGGSDDIFGSDKRQYKLKLSWGLDFGSAKNQIEQARYTLENAKLAHLQATEEIMAEVAEALSGYQLAVLKYNQAGQGIDLYQKDLELTKLKYQLGTVTAFAVRDAELNLLGAQLERDNADLDLQIAATKLRLKLGELYDNPSK